MESDNQRLYRRLAKHLDNLPAGYPATQSGVEIRILKRLFSPEEAHLALALTLIPEEARVVARRARLNPAEAEKRLVELAQKGLAFTIEPQGRPIRYMAAQFAIGIWEYHVNDLDEDLIRDVNEYFPRFMEPEVWQKSPQLRTIPVGRSVEANLEVMAYEQAAEMLKKQRKLVVAPCICRREHDIEGRPCDKPSETCLVMGWGADYYLRNGLGRRIDLEEALEILEKADKAGLVLQPSNAKKPTNICCCCGCCCQVLKNLKNQPFPAQIASSPFIAELNREDCTGCGVCVDRCQMEALTMAPGQADETAVLDLNRCIGCGLCVSTCPGKALTLVRKPAKAQTEIPENMIQAAIKMGRTRGKLSPAKMAAMALKSKMDRLLAAAKNGQ